MSFGIAHGVLALEAPFDGGSDASVDLVRTDVESHPESEWLQVMLPGSSHPATAAS
jgi:hypothetical protein